MPGDTDAVEALVTSLGRNGRFSDNIRQLFRYVRIKAAEEPDAMADFPSTEKACRLLFSQFIAQKSGLPKPTLADFLDVLSNAEFYRMFISQKAEEALDWHTFYKTSDPERALSDKEVEELEQIFDNHWRTVYIKIVKKTMLLDLYILFTSKPWSLADYFVRLLEYFPSSFKPINDQQPCPRHFIDAFSEKEREALLDVGEKSLLFVRESVEWLQARPPNVHILDALYSQEFLQTHSPPADLGRLENLLHYYLKHIATSYDTITTIFPAQTSHQ